MNWYKLFYWVSVADDVKHFFDWWSNFFSTFTILSIIVYAIFTICKAVQVGDGHIKKGKEEDNDLWRSFDLVTSKAFGIFKLCIIGALITWIFYVLIPTKKDALVIIAGGAVGSFISSDSNVKQLPAEATLLLRETIAKEIRHIRADTLVSDMHNVVDTLKDKTKAELIELIKEKTK